MIWNRYKRPEKKINVKIKDMIYRDGRYFLRLSSEHHLWATLTAEQRSMAVRFGAIEKGQDFTAFCPEFPSEVALIRYILWLLEQDDLDSELRNAIESRIIRGDRND